MAHKIETPDGGNVHVDGQWMADIDADTTWLREEAARFLAVADYLDKRRAESNPPIWREVDKYGGDEYA